MTSDPATLLDRRLLQAKAALALERLWSRSFALVMTVGSLVLAVLSGVFGALPWAARLTLMVVGAVAVLWSLRPILAFRWPQKGEALRHLEIHSELAHRPLTALKDRLPAESIATSKTIWGEHLARTSRSIRALKVGRPRSDWMARDPFALRNALGLGLIVALVLNGSNWRDEVASSLNVPLAGTSSVTLDAWITPPSYTGKPPLLLTGPELAARLAKSGEIVVPERSMLIVRFNDARRPKVRLAKPLEDGSAGDTVAEPELQARSEGRVHETRSSLDRPVTVVVSDGTRELANWRVSVVPDTPPEVSIRGDIETEANGALAFEWAVRDDYGVSSLAAKLRLSDTQDDGQQVKSEALLLFEPPSFAISLPKVSVAEADGKAIQDLTAHPWAGLMVEMVLTARDQAMQTGDSKPLRFKLPERSFEKPLAKALIEQRRTLVLDPERRQDIVRLLDALTLWPEGILEESSLYLGVRVARTSLYHTRSHDDIKATVALLWELAVAVEDGDVPEAKRALDEARKALQQALAEGAPPEKIAELMSRLREAMERYLAAMAQQALRNAQYNDKSSRQAPNGRTIRAEDLNRMLDAIDKLARSGANEAAQELLAQLEELLSNLQPSLAEQGMDQQMPPLADMLQDLGELLQRQQELMDKTFRLPRNGEHGDLSGQDGREPGMRGQRPGEPNALARQQDELGKLLEQLMAELGKNGLQVPEGLGRAEQDMGEAADALRQAERRRALGEQGEAMEGLRQGAEAMARELMQQGMGSQGNYGRHGEARGDDRDPLGRPLPSRGEDYGPERDMLPDEAAIERARQILEYLRGRASDMTRPRLERDYLDRLLRGLY
jgi:uncharacterized protein (TIGR02302 family)